MTNQNPASSQPLDRALLAKLNAHADRSLDRLFTDIDELLSGDLEAEHPPTTNRSALANYRAEAASEQQYDQAYTPQADRFSPQLTAEVDPPQAAKAQPKKSARRVPFWLKAVLGVGAGAIAVGGSLVWLVTERKIAVPPAIDTSWIPFQSKSQVSPEDAKFAEYMRKSISKIESAKMPATAPIYLPSPAASNVAPAAIPFSQAAITAPMPGKSIVAAKPIALVKTIRLNNGATAANHSAIFQIDKKDLPIKIGQKIGNSNWSLVNVSQTEVTVKNRRRDSIN